MRLIMLCKNLFKANEFIIYLCIKILIYLLFFSGAPQVLRPHPSMHTISVKRGESAVMSLVVCADPRPHRVSWEWGSLRLEAGSGIGKLYAYYL